MARIKRRGPKLNIVVLDACRNNPFLKSGSRSLGGTRGLASVAAPQGTFVMYSADAGEQALDRLKDGEKNSVFTRTLLAKIAEPGRDLVSVARSVRSEVRDLAATVNHQQTPAYYDAVIGNFYFTPPKAVVKTPKPPKPPKPPKSVKPTVSLKAQQELAFWSSIGSNAPTSAYQAYLKAYPEGQFVALANAFIESAKSKLKKIELAALPTKPVPKVETTIKQEPVVAKVASQEPPDTGAVITPQNPVLSRTTLVRGIQTELNRVGCNVGRVDGQAGRRTSFALKLFAKNTKFALPKELYVAEVLATLKKTSGTICTVASINPATPKKPKQNLRARKRKPAVKRRTTTRRKTTVRRKSKPAKRSRGSSCFKFNGKLVCG